jgi:hypothetical protein
MGEHLAQARAVRPGNHEFYGGSIAGTRDALARFAAGTNVRLLDDGETVIDGVRFLGTTLWTDFLLFGDGAKRAGAMASGRQLLRDSSRIRNTDDSPSRFTPQDAAALFDVHSRWLEARLATRFDGPTVVITHHAPSPKSIHPRFADSPLNACFVASSRTPNACSTGRGRNCGSTVTRTTASTMSSTERASCATRAGMRRTA